jgi:hypothetical protein
MNLLSLILIAMALIVGGCVFYVAWELSSGEFESRRQEEALAAQRLAASDDAKKEPGESKESEDPPGS